MELKQHYHLLLVVLLCLPIIERVCKHHYDSDLMGSYISGEM